MARPLKQGVDYFPLDVHIDNKLKFIKIKYGVEGFGIMICLLQHIYSLSYWCSCTDDDILLLSDELKVDYEKLKGVIEEAIKREFFNKNMYEKYLILTSKGIQKRYKEIVKRRKDVEIIQEYLVIENNFGVNVNINEVNANIKNTSCKHDASKSTQSKVNKTKVKENKPIKRFIPPTLEEVKKYCSERKNNVDAEKWLDFYESKGWMIGKNKMKSWKAAVRTWEKGSNNNQSLHQQQVKKKVNDFDTRDLSHIDLNERFR